MPHVDRAGQIRKHAANATGNAVKADPMKSADDASDLSSDEGDYDEIDSDDFDSDGFNEDMTDVPDYANAHSLSQQQDFVKF